MSLLSTAGLLLWVHVSGLGGTSADAASGAVHTQQVATAGQEALLSDAGSQHNHTVDVTVQTQRPCPELESIMLRPNERWEAELGNLGPFSQWPPSEAPDCDYKVCWYHQPEQKT